MFTILHVPLARSVGFVYRCQLLVVRFALFNWCRPATVLAQPVFNGIIIWLRATSNFHNNRSI